MLSFEDSYFLGETRNGFYIEPMMKCAWAAQLEVMCVIQQICEKHDIRYFADWGTLLGAVRHKGFIPWDDDMDICMLRSDYQKFLEIAPGELSEGYHINTIYTQENYNTASARIVNSYSISYDPQRLIEFHGCPYIVGVDIFPLDKIPADPAEEQVQNQLVSILLNASQSCDEHLDEVLQLLPEFEELCGVKFDPHRNIRNQILRTVDLLSQLYNSTKSTYISYITENALRGLRLRDEWYDSCQYLPFENLILPVPGNYDAVLTEMYGDYMVPVQGTALHEYPFYKKQTKAMIETITHRLTNGEAPFDSQH